MIKKLSLLTLILCLGITTNASHLMGGEISVKMDENDSAHVTLTLYGDGAGIMLPADQLVEIRLPGGQVENVTVYVVKTDTMSSVYLATRKVYKGSVYLGNYPSYVAVSTAKYSLCCRSANIGNLQNPSSSDMVLLTEFYYQRGVATSSPEFLNEPIIEWPLDTMWSYNPMPYDAEGDSLVWSLDTPLTDDVFPTQGYYHPPAIPGKELKIDPVTGLITFSASQMGVYVVSILVEEYDDSTGAKIGETRRDMQLIVVPNHPGAMTFTPPQDSLIVNGVPAVAFTANTSNSLSFSLASADTAVSLEMTASGDPFQTDSSNASFSTVFNKSTAGTLTGTFEWTPRPEDCRENIYRLNVRVRNGRFSYDYTMGIVVNANLSVDEPRIADKLSLYPNPNAGNFSIETEGLEAGQYQQQIRDISGRVLFEDRVDVAPGLRISVNKELKNGTYILTLQKDGITSTKTFIVR